MEDSFRTGRHGMLSVAALLAAGAAWRAIVALQHYQLFLASDDDPSAKEFEQVSAVFEAGVSLILLAHVVGLLALSRRPFEIRWRYALAVALVCTVAVGGSLLSVPGLSWPGAYPVLIVTAVAALSHLLAFGWVSLYLGASAGSLLAWYSVAPATDWFACLFVAGSCTALAFLGGGLKLLVMRIGAAVRSR